MSLIGDHKYLVFRGQTIKLTLDQDNLWRSDDGTLFALRDDSSSVDSIDRCGVGVFSINKDSEVTPACAVHDYMYSSPVYQLFHTREEADEWLKTSTSLLSRSIWTRIITKPFYILARLFGGKFWENNNTR